MVLAATVNPVVPAAGRLAPLVIVTHDELLVAVQAQPDVVVTVIEARCHPLARQRLALWT